MKKTKKSEKHKATDEVILNSVTLGAIGDKNPFLDAIAIKGAGEALNLAGIAAVNYPKTTKTLLGSSALAAGIAVVVSAAMPLIHNISLFFKMAAEEVALKGGGGPLAIAKELFRNSSDYLGQHTDFWGTWSTFGADLIREPAIIAAGIALAGTGAWLISKVVSEVRHANKPTPPNAVHKSAPDQNNL